ncbi:glucuronate isomerase [Thaumasiovibrio subtropicus]|uniref:glucuronate isomerase n=1 Tax=Thaumasiovibrio subtropicus TaxID=1891207 RepID=UPI000B34CF4C|nr:glucuronate isomerase [Thaumasiovibrio subtropicus]
MKSFICDDFQLNNETAKRLYHSYAKTLPIIDYHNHLSAQEIFEDITFDNIAQAWLGHDHYKWRAMRSNAIDESFITGSGSDRDKFEHWCATVPQLIGNPLYQWTHLELRRYFGIDAIINANNSAQIWEEANAKISQADYSARNMIRMMNVESLCTTDDPLDDLRYHKGLADAGFEVKVLPTFRADALYNIDRAEAFLKWVGRLSEVVEFAIDDIHALFEGVSARFDYFHQAGCRLSDMGLAEVDFEECTLDDADQVFKKVLAGSAISPQEAAQFKTQIFKFIGQKNHALGWTFQLHIGVLQDPNKRRFAEVGPVAGFSAINDTCFAKNLSLLLNALDFSRQLPQTILYCLNPRDNYVLAGLIGAFQDSDAAPGKVQFGSAWWFNDQKDGMLEQLKALANLGLLGRFVGMLTDSRSLLSFPRHEYFRRIVCNLLGEWVEQGELPDDEALLKDTVEAICYRNAKRYFAL